MERAVCARRCCRESSSDSDGENVRFYSSHAGAESRKRSLWRGQQDQRCIIEPIGERQCHGDGGVDEDGEEQ